MRLLVTGGAGFIGSNFVYYIRKLRPKYHITVLDKLTYSGNKDNIKQVIDEIKFVEADICNANVVMEVMRDIDIVVHFAAESHVDNSILNSDPFIMTNVLGTQRLLQAAINRKVSLFLHISTDEVYGDLSYDDDDSFDEETCLWPSSPYSVSKCSADMLVHMASRTYGLKTIITRASNNYGPFQHIEKFIPKCITNLLQNKRIPVYGNGVNVRDWLYVTDHCAALLKVLENGVPGNIYNIASGNEMKNIDVVHFILSHLHKGDEMIEFVDDRLGHDRKYSMSYKKIFDDLNWQPQLSWETALANTVKWYSEHSQWWLGMCGT